MADCALTACGVAACHHASAAATVHAGVSGAAHAVAAKAAAAHAVVAKGAGAHAAGTGAASHAAGTDAAAHGIYEQNVPAEIGMALFAGCGGAVDCCGGSACARGSLPSSDRAPEPLTPKKQSKRMLRSMDVMSIDKRK